MGYVGVAPSTTTITLPDGETIALADWIDDRLYSTVEFSNGDSTPLEAFSNGRSQTIPGGNRNLTRVDTNVPRQGGSGLPKDWSMLIYGFGIKYVRAMRPNQSGNITLIDANGSFSDPTILRTIFELDRLMFFNFVYNGKGYTEGVPQNYPTGHGFYVFSTNTGFEYANNGIPSPRDRLAMVLPVYMRENLGYWGVFQPETILDIVQAASDGGADLDSVDIKLELNGLIKRPVV